MRGYWYVYGGGGLGIETMDILSDYLSVVEDSSWDCLFVVDNPQCSRLMGKEVVSWSSCRHGSRVSIAVGEPFLRATLAAKCLDRGLELASIISPRAYVSSEAMVSNGVIVGPFASIQANAVIGSNVAINTQAIIGHHVRVDEHSVISSQANLGGASTVGSSSYIGMGALIKENVNIGSGVIIGMGSVLYKNISDSLIALGNPARPVKKNDERKVFKGDKYVKQS